MVTQQYKDDGEYDNAVFILKLLYANIHNNIISTAKLCYFNAEYMYRTLTPTQREKLGELYVKIKYLYSIYFMQLVNGKIKDSNELINTLHEKIREDEKLIVQCDEFKEIMSRINEIHKTGMLHQLADTDKDIIWINN